MEKNKIKPVEVPEFFPPLNSLKKFTPKHRPLVIYEQKLEIQKNRRLTATMDMGGGGGDTPETMAARRGSLAASLIFALVICFQFLPRWLDFLKKVSQFYSSLLS